MKELTEKDLAWQRGFEAGVGFTLRHLREEKNVSEKATDA